MSITKIRDDKRRKNGWTEEAILRDPTTSIAGDVFMDMEDDFEYGLKYHSPEYIALFKDFFEKVKLLPDFKYIKESKNQ